MSYNGRKYLEYEEHRLAFPEDTGISYGHSSHKEPTWSAVAKIAAEMREKYGPDEMRRLNEEFEQRKRLNLDI